MTPEPLSLNHLTPQGAASVLAPALVRAEAAVLQERVEQIAAEERLAAAERTLARVAALLPSEAPERGSDET